MRTIALLFALLLAGCDNKVAPSDSKSGEGSESACLSPITPIVIGQGEDSGLPESCLIINTNADWQDLLSKMPSYETDRFTETNIDFSKFTVIAVFDERLYGDRIEIIGICEYADRVVAKATIHPGLAAVISAPFHIVKIPKTNKPVVFKCVFGIKPVPRDLSC